MNVKKIGQSLLTLGIVGFMIYQNFFAFGSKVTFGAEEHVYYLGDCTEAQAQKVGETLQTLGIFNGSNPADIQIDKDGELFLLRFVVKEEYLNKKEFEDVLATIGFMVSKDAFGGAKLAVEMCDDRFKPKKRVAMKAPPTEEAVGEAEAETEAGAEAAE